MISVEHDSSTWTPERVERLTALVEERLSAKEIAEILGCPSRNAVIGKVSRLGLKLKGARSQKSHKTKVIKPRRDCRTPFRDLQSIPVAPVEVVSAVADPLNISFAGIGAFQCRWVTSAEGAPTTFCGHYALSGSWCDQHRQQVFAAPVPRPSRLARVA